MYKKVIVSGDIIEIYEMDYMPFGTDLNNIDDGYKALDIPQTIEDTLDANFVNRKEKECRVEERRLQTARDARNKIRRLALSNFSDNSKFMTLTFKDNITDLDVANKMFKKYIRYLRSHVKKFKYIAVIEFQKRGAVHYHMICNLPYVKHSQLLDYWQRCCGSGAVNVKNISNVDNVGAYLVKYMMKNAGDSRLKGKKMYLNNKGLEQPKVYNGYSAELVIREYLKEKEKVFTNSYESEYLGKIVYKEYNLKREKSKITNIS